MEKQKSMPFEKSFASHEKSIYWSKKNKLESKDVYRSSHKKYFFDCICGHEIELQLNYIVHDGVWCLYCSNKLLCNDEKCQICYDKSFASHPKSFKWSSKNNVTAREVFLFSKKKYFFECEKCDHIYEQLVANVTNDKGCQYCTNQKLCDNKNCDYCFRKSFASHSKAHCWSKKNNISSRIVFLSSNLSYYFDCDQCHHEFEKTLSDVTKGDRLGWCCYCAHRRLCDDDNCKFCFQNSFAASPKINCWDKEKNTDRPRDVFLSAGKKYYFNCKKCKQSFQTSPHDVSNGRWCSFCKTKTESKVYDNLSPFYQQLKRRYCIDWCKDKKFLPFDFALEDLKIIIELDGLQHFKQVSNWTTPEKAQNVDKYKMNCANENGFSVIRILQDDVWNNRYKWLEELMRNIEKVSNDNKVQNVYMCKNNEYDVYM